MNEFAPKVLNGIHLFDGIYLLQRYLSLKWVSMECLFPKGQSQQIVVYAICTRNICTILMLIATKPHAKYRKLHTNSSLHINCVQQTNYQNYADLTVERLKRQ